MGGEGGEEGWWGGVGDWGVLIGRTFVLWLGGRLAGCLAGGLVVGWFVAGL